MGTKLGKSIYRQIDQSNNWFRDWYYYQHKYCFVNLVHAQQMRKLNLFLKSQASVDLFFSTDTYFNFLLTNSFRYKVCE